VKNPRIRCWSSFDVRKHSRSERALEAGSLVAKPRARWRAPSGALVDGRHFGPGKSHSLTRVRTERFSPLRQIRSPNPAEWDRECQRPNRTTLHAVENAAARWHRPVRCSSFPIRARAWSVSPKLDTCRQACVYLGFCFRKEAERRPVALNTCQRDGRSARRKSCARESNGLWVLVS
jgi:hypothetical protein